MERGELQGRLIPYADDVVLLSPKKPGAELKWIQGFMQRLGLTLHPEKTRVLYIRKGDLNFLGYTHRRRYGRLCLDASKKAQGRIRDELRRIRRKTRRTWLSLEQLVAELNLYTCGARQDFRRIRKRTLSNWTASANNESRGVGRESTPALAHHGRSCKGSAPGANMGCSHGISCARSVDLIALGVTISVALVREEEGPDRCGEADPRLLRVGSVGWCESFGRYSFFNFRLLLGSTVARPKSKPVWKNYDNVHSATGKCKTVLSAVQRCM